MERDFINKTLTWNYSFPPPPPPPAPPPPAPPPLQFEIYTAAIFLVLTFFSILFSTLVALYFSFKMRSQLG